MGYRQVFPHVGENTAITLGGKRIYPLVTGTFGGMDFIHSLLGYDLSPPECVCCLKNRGAVSFES